MKQPKKGNEEETATGTNTHQQQYQQQKYVPRRSSFLSTRKLNRVRFHLGLGALCDSVSGELTLNKQADVAAAMGIATTLFLCMPAAEAAAKHQHAAMANRVELAVALSRSSLIKTKTSTAIQQQQQQHHQRQHHHHHHPSGRATCVIC